MELFTYKIVNTVQEAVQATANEDTLFLAGGTDLIPLMKAARRQPTLIVDIKRVPELADIIEHEDGSVTIGAAVKATAIAQHKIITRTWPALASSVALIGSRQIQNRATLGGNVCNAAPSADAIPALICYDAEARITGNAGERSQSVEGLFLGPGKTTLSADELLLSFHLPKLPMRTAAAYQRFTPRREMDIAIAGVGSRLSLDDDGKILEARIALASVGPTPLRAPEAEKLLCNEIPSSDLFSEAGRVASDAAQPISDTRGSADYRRHLVSVLCKRTLSSCASQLAEEMN